MISNTFFWQVNIWGLAGLVMGLVSIIVSLTGWRHSKPKIRITKLDLIRKNPMQINEWYVDRPKEQMRDHILNFKLRIILKNRGNGSGSVEKPILILSMPPTEKKLFGNKNKIIKIEPRTKYYEPTKTNSTVWDTQTTGKEEHTWKINGGQIIDDEIEYVIQDINDLYSLVDNYAFIEYSIEYSDNSGKKYFEKINSIFDEN